jgi:hypothetical protein
VDAPSDSAAESTVLEAARGGKRFRRIGLRVALLLVTGISLYLLLPSVLETFSSFGSLGEIGIGWSVGMLVLEAASFLCVWELQRTALETREWFPVGTSQLAGYAFGKIVPGGMATSGAMQYRMLVRAGIPNRTAVAGLTAVSVLTFGSLLALPLLSLPAIVAGAPVDRGLARAALLGVAAFALMAAAGAALFLSGRAVDTVGRILQTLINLIRRRSPVAGVPERLRSERDALVRAFGERWRTALLAALGRWVFEYGALLAALLAVGAHPRASLVLLAFVASSLLTMIPITPGGLGFVEAGLIGTLGLAGVEAGDAVVATLGFRLVSFWLPLPAGFVAAGLFRHRYRTW